MKYEIRYHEIMSDHILAVPQFSHKEIIDAATPSAVRSYVESKKDGYGNHFKEASTRIKKLVGFDYTSSAGAVKVKKYKAPKVKKI